MVYTGEAIDAQTAQAAQVGQLEEEIERLEEEVERKKKGIIDTLNEKAEVGVRLQRYDTLLEQGAARQAQIRAQLLQVKSSLETWQEAAAAQTAEREALEGRLKEAKANGEAAAAAVTEAEALAAGPAERGRAPGTVLRGPPGDASEYCRAL